MLAPIDDGDDGVPAQARQSRSMYTGRYTLQHSLIYGLQSLAAYTYLAVESSLS